MNDPRSFSNIDLHWCVAAPLSIFLMDTIKFSLLLLLSLLRHCVITSRQCVVEMLNIILKSSSFNCRFDQHNIANAGLKSQMVATYSHLNLFSSSLHNMTIVMDQIFYFITLHTCRAEHFMVFKI